MAASISKGGASKWLDRLAWPPLLGVVVLGIVMLLNRGRSISIAHSDPMPIIVAFGLLYVGLIYAYPMLLKQGSRGASKAAVLVADGLSIVFLTWLFRAPTFIGWIGAVLMIGGVIFGLTHMTPKQPQRFAQISSGLLPSNIGKTEIKAIMSTIIFPAAFLEMNDEGEERIVAANDPFAAVLGRVADKLAGVKFADLIPPDVESQPVRFADAEWVAHRTAKGRQTMFMLSPSVSVKEPEPAPAAFVGDGTLIDAETGLYTQFYMKYKCESDLALCRRYKRQFSVVVFFIDFSEKNLVSPSDDAKRSSFAAFGRLLMQELRRSDTPCRTGDGEVTVFLPETSQKGAKVAVERVFEMVKKAAHLEVPELAQASITETTITFFGDELASLDSVMNEVQHAKTRKKKK